jgi:hypothetical protein
MIVLGYIEIHLKGCIGNINGDGIKCSCEKCKTKSFTN